MNRFPMHVRARREAPPGRGLWLVKWLLLVPHYIVLAFLWVAFVACTVVAYVAVLFTGRYPQGIFHFNVGVLRWSWRVGYYGYEVLGTDRYPPFTLAEVPDYPAGLTVEYPPRLPRWRPLVAWLFAIPHAVIIGALTGAGAWQFQNSDHTTTAVPLTFVGTVALIIGCGLLFTGRHLVGLYNLLVGVARWQLRVIGYVALLTDRYPPFRLDLGDLEPDDGPDGGGAGAAAAMPTAMPATMPATMPAVTPPAMPGTTTAAVPAPAAGNARSGSVAGYVVALVAGVVVFLVGVGLTVGGGAVLTVNAARDAGGFVTSRALDVSSSTAAITAEDLTIQAGDAWSRSLSGFGDLRVTATGTNGTPLFLGVAAQSDVDRWLAGTAHDQLTDVYGTGSAQYTRAAGTLAGVPAPTGQTFWLAKATGTATTTLNWHATNGRFAVVLSNADGSRGVTATVRAATRLPDLAPLGWGLTGTGIGLIVAAILLIVLGATGIGRRHTPGAGGPPPYPVAPPRAPVGVPSGTGTG